MVTKAMINDLIKRENPWETGDMPRGVKNQITDVPGVSVGHCTYSSGEIQTGVTLILPTRDNIYLRKCPAATSVFNGFGKSVGLLQIDELGQLESPIALTNTLNVGKVSDGLVTLTIEDCKADGVDVMTFNPVVMECNDSYLNDIKKRAVTAADVKKAASEAAEIFKEGAVGAGRGMSCHGLKGGIGSSSRTLVLDGNLYTLGVLVQANHGRLSDLSIDQIGIGKALERYIKEDKWHKPEDSLKKAMAEGQMGSIITVMATDLPLHPQQIKRVLNRAQVGIARVGGFISHGSGEVAIGFSTANRMNHSEENAVLSGVFIADHVIDEVFRAMAEATEEAILKALFFAESVTGYDGNKRLSLTEALNNFK